MPQTELDPNRFSTRQLDAMIALEKAFERCKKHGIVFAIYHGGLNSMGMYALTEAELKQTETADDPQAAQIDIGEPTNHHGTIRDVGGM